MVIVLWRKLVQALSSNSVLQVLSSPTPTDDVNSDEEEESQDEWKSPIFNSEKQVRIILFQESDLNGRKILFDSKSLIQKNAEEIKTACLKENKKTNSLSNSEHITPETENLKRNSLTSSNDKSAKPNLDVHMLEEMMFGSVGMTYWGTTMKVHTVRSPPHLVISLVFPAPVPNENKTDREKDLEESGSWHHSSNEIQISKCSEKISSVAHSVPVDVPGGPSFSNHHNYGNRYIISDSLQSTGSTSSFVSMSHLSPNSVSSSLSCSGSYNSLQRRWLRNMATSIEFGLYKKSEDNIYGDEIKENGQRKIKLGLSIVISLDENNPEESSQFQEFFFSHVTIIEGHVFRLKNSVSKAYLNRKKSVTLTCEGIKKFHKSLQDLYTAPRLSCPFWLSRMLPDKNYHYLCSKFIKQFVSLLDKYEKKETNFFVSTLLTAVLTHHLAWVPTVTPSNMLMEEIGNKKNTTQWLEILAKSYPYNPLWMQLGDMYGCLGFPNKFARTIITGKNYGLINNFLFILSYFIRCSGIWEKVFEKSIIDEENLTPLSANDINLTSADLKTSDDIENANKQKTFANSFFPKRRYSLQQDFNKWTKNSYKNLSLENECDHNRSKDMNWDHYCMKFDFETEHNMKSFDFNSLNKSDNFLHNNNEDTVFLLDENLSFNNNFDNHKSALQMPNEFHKSEPLMDSLGYSSLDDQLDEKHLPKQLWDHNNIHSIKHDSLINNSTSHKCEEKNEFLPNMNMTKYNKVTNCNENEKHSLLESSTSKCLPQIKLELDCSDDYAYKVGSQSLIKYQRLKECMNPEKWHQCKLNAVLKTTSDDGPEEGYHSMEETKVTSKPIKVNLSENKNNFLRKVTELQLPKFQVKEVQTTPSLYRGYGWSLLAGTSNHYMSDFCLQGIKGCVKENEIRDDLLTTIEFPVLGDPITEAVGIIADIDKWKVKLISSNRINGDCEGSYSVHIGMSSLVADICESVLQMHKLNMPAELCMMHLEDRMQELYFRSRFLAEYLCNEPSDIGLNKVTTALNLNLSDINLLIAIATTHTPQQCEIEF